MQRITRRFRASGVRSRVEKLDGRMTKSGSAISKNVKITGIGREGLDGGRDVNIGIEIVIIINTNPWKQEDIETGTS